MRLFLDPAHFRRALQERLLKAAETAEGARADTLLMAAAMLERGERCPAWIADPYVSTTLQDVYGWAIMDAPPDAQRAIYDAVVKK